MRRLCSPALLAIPLLLCACSEETPAPVAPAATQHNYSLTEHDDFSGENAYVHCNELCKIGPRPSGSEGYEKQLQYLTRYLEQYGWTVTRQSFTAPHGVRMTNLHAVFGDTTQGRTVLLTCHIDTKINISDDFVGADDGASGAAILLEAARILAKRPQEAAAIELVFFDGEEAVAERMTETDGLYGSRHDVERRGADLPRYQINLDMVGARNKTIGVPLFDCDPILMDTYVDAVKALGLNEKKWTVTDQSYWDDDRYFREAGVGTINLICDFVDSIWWHTPRDNMSRICPKSLHESGLVTLELLRRVISGLN